MIKADFVKDVAVVVRMSDFQKLDATMRGVGSNVFVHRYRVQVDDSTKYTVCPVPDTVRQTLNRVNPFVVFPFGEDEEGLSKRLIGYSVEVFRGMEDTSRMLVQLFAESNPGKRYCVTVPGTAEGTVVVPFKWAKMLFRRLDAIPGCVSLKERKSTSVGFTASIKGIRRQSMVVGHVAKIRSPIECALFTKLVGTHATFHTVLGAYEWTNDEKTFRYVYCPDNRIGKQHTSKDKSLAAMHQVDNNTGIELFLVNGKLDRAASLHAKQMWQLTF